MVGRLSASRGNVDVFSTNMNAASCSFMEFASEKAEGRSAERFAQVPVVTEIHSNCRFPEIVASCFLETMTFPPPTPIYSSDPIKVYSVEAGHVCER